ncbi:inner membrane peptidase. Serine peptidase. MEROPS family S49 [Thalassolituus maritimus]|uniref:Inner membrane peptidase. Serine peptidase. MEROPS family S49 n=1 Tax=Thalassolituus maritimus TaxID=484498 RepID=A0A1N7Q0L5_9GAMM|nr:protease SohB [Thalassolituus maritimus]SIT16351.1 inner membrane peptidase. Serine peptidase. MEROPS family S49 [Thalassolituus maritimus]
MEFIADYGSFLLKTVTLVVAILVVAGGMIALGSRQKKSGSEGELKIRKLNEQLEDYKEQLENEINTEATLKQLEKDRKKEDKAKQKAEKKAASAGADASKETKRVYVIDFDGDIKASDVDLMRREITAILTMATKDDEVVVRLESGGGMVHSYGLAASQLKRIRDKGIQLTVCIDKVAASGGYMMACLADRVVAAPFAIVGSIGVVAQLPNFNKLLKKNDVDFEMFTAGEYKRTVTMFGENTDKAREKFQSDLNDTHVLFKQHVKQFRPRVDIDAVATGDIWYGQQALDQKLIDEVGTSDDYLVSACERADVYTVAYEYRRSFQERMGFAAQAGFERAVTRVLTAVQNQMQTKG